MIRLKFVIDTYNDPLWAQDGSDVLLLGRIENQQSKKERIEWLQVSANGFVRQVTHLGDVFQNSLYEMVEPSRSWDGNFLFFQLGYEEPEESSKYILLDLNTDFLEGYCIPVNSVGKTGFKYPYWSPDSNYLIISDTDRYLNGGIILVDVGNQTSFKIAEDMKVIGWIAKP